MNATSHPLVSVVTPVYNEEDFLAECIESVLAQTYQNWEYIIVNNCSTDRSLEIARHYAATDSRIRVHENVQFLNMLDNHNRAVQQISSDSKYCKVVLGDDWIFPGCLEQMVAVAEAHPSVGIVSAYQLYGEHIYLTGLPYQHTLVPGRDVCREFFMRGLCLFGTQTSVLYRADLVRGRIPFYTETDACCPDWDTCLALLRESDLGFVHQVLTFSRLRPNSFGAITWDMGANLGSMLDFLFGYGRACLTEEEFGECLARQLAEYYRFLGRRAWVEHDGTFWSYHKRILNNNGIPFSIARLLRGALGQLAASLLHPRNALESLARLSRLRQIRSRQMRRVILESKQIRVSE